MRMKEEDEKAWARAKKKRCLSHETIKMTQALGLNPKKLGKIDNHKQEPWETPLPIFIESLYEKQQTRVKAKQEKAERKFPLSSSLLTD